MRPVFALILTCLTLKANLAFSASTPTPNPSTTPNLSDAVAGKNELDNPNGFFKYQENPEYKNQTLKMIEEQARLSETGDRSTRTHMLQVLQGQSRAEQMVEALKNQDLEKAMAKVTARGNAILESNTGLKAPASVIAGAVALWVGRSIRVFNDSGYELNTRIEARSRSGEFNLNSPFLNSRVLYNPDQGVSVNLNRNIASLRTQAEMNYNTQSRIFSTQLVQPLSSGFSLSVGAGSNLNQSNQTDGRASLQYNLNF
jgi:hypothetical protein